MESTSTITHEEGANVAGKLAYIQFMNKLTNYIENEILSEGWEKSVDSLAKIVSKKNLPSFNKALHGAILGGLNESFNEMFSSQVDLPKLWSCLDQEENSIRDHITSHPDPKITLMSSKIEHKNAILSIIEEKKKKITEIKQQINITRLALLRKMAKLEDTKLVMDQNMDKLEQLESITF